MAAVTDVQDAFVTNWIAPLGPHVDAFERAIELRRVLALGPAVEPTDAGRR